MMTSITDTLMPALIYFFSSVASAELVHRCYQSHIRPVSPGSTHPGRPGLQPALPLQSQAAFQAACQ